MPKLIVKHPDAGEQVFPISGARITVGRRTDNDVQILHGTVSGYHAEIVALQGHYLLRDLDSTNHCFIDGVLTSEAKLTARCKILFGDIECEYVPEVPAPPTDESNLRRTIGLLRQQNEALADRIADQQKQIRILGSARLVTPGTSSDLVELRERVKALTEERDRLARENHEQLLEIDRLRNRERAQPREGAQARDDSELRATVPLALPPSMDDRAVRIGPGGDTTIVAPMAPVVPRGPTAKGEFASWNREAAGWTAETETLAQTQRLSPQPPSSSSPASPVPVSASADPAADEANSPANPGLASSLP